MEYIQEYPHGWHILLNNAQKAAKSGRRSVLHCPKGFRYTIKKKKNNIEEKNSKKEDNRNLNNGDIFIWKCTHHAKCKAEVWQYGRKDLPPIFQERENHEIDGVPHPPAPRLFHKCQKCVLNQCCEMLIKSCVV